MDPHKNKTLRISYYSKVTKKPKYKQVKVKNYENEEAAKAYLEEWKRQEILKDREKFEGVNIAQPETHADIVEPVLNPEPDIINLVPKSITQTIQIIPNIEYSPFKINAPNFNESGGGRSILILGVSGAGKTTLTKYITLKYLVKPKDAITIFMSPSITQKIYTPIKKNKNIISMDFYNERMIHDIAKIQKKTNQKYKGFCFILDDLVGKNIKKSDELLQMLLTYRNLNISTLLNSQGTKLVSKDGRNNVNNIYILRQSNPEAIKEILDIYIGGYEPFNGLSNDQKLKLFLKATENNNYIYLDTFKNKLSFHYAIEEI